MGCIWDETLLDFVDDAERDDSVQDARMGAREFTSITHETLYWQCEGMVLNLL